MLWTVDPSKADMVVVITEGVAEVAMDIMVAVEINQQPLMVLTFQTSHSFTRQEWEALGDGCNIVQQLREQNQNGGHGWGPLGHGRGG